MAQQSFKVKPVVTYDRPRYFAAPVEESRDLPLEERHHPLVLAVMFLLIAGMTVGLIGCYLRSDYQPDPPDAAIPDGDPPDPPPGCDQTYRCVDQWNLEICDEGEWTGQSCSDYCTENYGWDYYPTSCDAERADPCGCEYGMIAGEMIECYPEDVYCIDENTIEYCDYDWYATESCDQYCQDHFGPDFVAGGCDEAVADNPCQCEVAIEPTCELGAYRCADDGWTLEQCEGAEGWVPDQTCDVWCVAVYGLEYYSNGCDAEAEEICQCEYGMIDGDMAECVPGEVICFDEATLGVCPESGGWYEAQGCAELCVEALGEGAVSGGCDLTDPEDPCGCSAPDSGSGSGE